MHDHLQAWAAFERVKIRFTLEITSPLAIGSGETLLEQITQSNGQTRDVELKQLALDNQGCPYIPGSSFKGLLRGACQTALPVELQNQLSGLFAQAPQASASSDDSSSGQFMRVYDIRSHKGAFDISTSQHNKINPVTKTVLDQHLFIRKCVAAGAKFHGCIELDRIHKNTLDGFIELLYVMADVDSGYGLGAGQNIQQGIFHLNIENIVVVEQSEFREWITQPASARLPWCDYTYEQAIQRRESAHRPIPFVINTLSPLLILEPQKVAASPKNEIVFKTLNNCPYIPASTLLGVWRSRCRKILATMLYQNQDWQQLCNNNAANQATVDSIIDTVFGNQKSASMVSISDAVMSDYKPERHDHYQSFNAIDRFTGEVKDGALFSVKAIDLASFNFSIKIDINRLNKHAPSMIIIVLLAMKDFYMADVKMGWGTNKGFGHIQLRPADSNLKDWDALLNSVCQYYELSIPEIEQRYSDLTQLLAEKEVLL